MIITDQKPTTPQQSLSFETFDDRNRQLEQHKMDDEKTQERAKYEARKSPFKSFFQVNKENTKHMRSLIDENPIAFKLFLFLCEHMDNYNAVICSYKVLSDVLGVSTRTVSRCIACLRDHGFIAVAKSGTANVYIANKDLVWNSWGDNVKYCKFPANVILSFDEQNNEIKVHAKHERIIEEVANNEDK